MSDSDHRPTESERDDAPEKDGAPRPGDGAPDPVSDPSSDPLNDAVAAEAAARPSDAESGRAGEPAADARPDGGAETSAEDEPERLYTKSDVDALRAEAQERLLRVLAEYDNFRRRTAREKEKWTAEALEQLVRDLLPVFDSFEKARTTETDDPAAIREGLEVVHRQLAGVLARHDIDVLDPVGQPFDPELHEALMRQPSPDHAPGTVVTVFERGYKIGPRLLRPARTVVADEA